MTYDTTVPSSGQSLGETQSIIQSNFSILDTANSVNHIAYSAAGQGKHLFLQIPEVLQADIPATAANEGALYTKEADSVTNLFFRQESNGTEIQLTTSQTPSAATNGYTFLPGGILIQWNTEATAGGTQTITFPITFSAPAYSVSVTGHRDSSNIDTVYIIPASIAADEFETRRTGAGIATMSWIAIGPA